LERASSAGTRLFSTPKVSFLSGGPFRIHPYTFVHTLVLLQHCCIQSRPFVLVLFQSRLLLTWPPVVKYKTPSLNHNPLSGLGSRSTGPLANI
jgi:hypothetical protein